MLSGWLFYVDALESRVSELAERLDFTERLLAGTPLVGVSPRCAQDDRH